MSSRVLTPYERTQLRRHKRTDQELLQAGELPVEYLTGVVEFHTLELLVTQDTLIPRIETEGLIDHVLPLLLKSREKLPQGETLRVADVGTGCGAIAITLLHKLMETSFPAAPLLEVLASDISTKAVEVAKLNSKKILSPKAQEQLRIFTSDLLTDFPKNTAFHAMIANLPYIPTSRIATLDTSVKDYEPLVALDGGSDGLQLITQFLDQAVEYVVPGGWVFLEVDYTHTESAFARHRTHWSVHTFVDDFFAPEVCPP
jgi:release factor glutamine methyltransferase